ncbi:hypothetical protein [Cellulomonas hominis]|uniref:hypothetical protein n=1 Tax=Cellulomonas hominis TaxID=156981 RepID=UPI001B965D43|nr:hypothetical protein [Cellulomonas hominis]VTR75423.1 hypothetical protein CHMI_00167 [Cellulomonas hominis]
MRPLAAGAVLTAVLLLTACTDDRTGAGAPEPSTAAPTAEPTTPTPAPTAGPQPSPGSGPALDAAVAAAFVVAVGEDLGRDSSDIADELLHQGVFICATLSVAEASPDEAVAVYEQYLAEDPALAGPLWDNAVLHLCPELVDGYELVLDRAQAAG